MMMTKMEAPYNTYYVCPDGAVWNEKTGNWLTYSAHRQGYKQCNLRAPGHKEKKLYLHQAVLLGNGVAIPDGMVVDHIDGDPTNNALTNLRVVTQSTNKRNSNSSRNAKGYYYHKQTGKYEVHFTEQRRKLHFGRYATEAEAAAVAAKARTYFNTHNTYAGFTAC